MSPILQAADIFSMGHNLGTRLGGLLGFFLILVIGLKALGHVLQERHALAVVLILVALIPAWLIFDPAGATNTFKSTVAGIGH